MFVCIFKAGSQPVQVLGREVLQKPSRVTYLAAQDRIVVTDDGTKSLRLFSASDGLDLGSLCPPVELENHIQQPVGHCEYHGQIAVIDFKSKSVLMWHPVDKKSSTKIATDMQCPAYVAATSCGRLAITDWKVNSFYTLGSLL